jgi:hypothetical protein
MVEISKHADDFQPAYDFIVALTNDGNDMVRDGSFRKSGGNGRAAINPAQTHN